MDIEIRKCLEIAAYWINKEREYKQSEKIVEYVDLGTVVPMDVMDILKKKVIFSIMHNFPMRVLCFRIPHSTWKNSYIYVYVAIEKCPRGEKINFCVGKNQALRRAEQHEYAPLNIKPSQWQRVPLS